MSLFSAYVIPTCHAVSEMQANETITNRLVEENTLSKTALGLPLIWPTFILMCEFSCIVTFLSECRSKGWRVAGKSLWQFLRKLFDFFFDRRAAKASSYIRYCAIVSHISSTVTGVLFFAWFGTYLTRNADNFKTYAEITSIVFLYGWIHTIEYVKGFPPIHAFVRRLYHHINHRSREYPNRDDEQHLPGRAGRAGRAGSAGVSLVHWSSWRRLIDIAAQYIRHQKRLSLSSKKAGV